MKNFYFEGVARHKGAIGIRHPFTETVRDVETLEAARLALYDTWEHILITKEQEFYSASPNELGNTLDRDSTGGA